MISFAHRFNALAPQTPNVIQSKYLKLHNARQCLDKVFAQEFQMTLILNLHDKN